MNQPTLRYDYVIGQRSKGVNCFKLTPLHAAFFFWIQNKITIQ